jgi:hypothetical protein
LLTRLSEIEQPPVLLRVAQTLEGGQAGVAIDAQIPVHGRHAAQAPKGGQIGVAGKMYRYSPTVVTLRRPSTLVEFVLSMFNFLVISCTAPNRSSSCASVMGAPVVSAKPSILATPRSGG